MKAAASDKTNVFDSSKKNHAHKLERFELLNHVTEEGIWDYDLVSKEVYYNRAFCKMFGYTQKEMKNNAVWWNKSLHPDEQTDVTRSFHQTLESVNTKWQKNYRLRCKNGTYKLIVDRIYIQRDVQGKALRIIGIVADLSNKTITQIQSDHIKNENRRKALMEAIAANEHSQRLISYELNESVNQLLASVKLYVGEVKKYVTSEGLLLLQRSEENLTSAITAIHDLSKKISPGEIELLGLQAAFEEVIHAMHPTKSIKTNYQIDEKTDELLSQTIKTVLYRIFVILAENAYRHANCTRITCKVGFEGNRICLTITDNGKGFEIEKVQFGLGFTRMKMVAEIMDGSYQFLQTKHGGASVRFCLPV